MIIDEKDTSERLLFAAINLIAEKGFHAVTTKEIAKEASVSEMTLFRHFGTKKRIVSEAVDRFYYSTSMQELFKQNIIGDLEQDLRMISRVYLEVMKKNKNVILIAFKEGNTIEGLYDQINKHPRQLKELLISYFLEMQADGKMMLTSDAEGLAMSYLYMLYGGFVSRNFVDGQQITSIDEEEFVESAVSLFVSALAV